MISRRHMCSKGEAISRNDNKEDGNTNTSGASHHYEIGKCIFHDGPAQPNVCFPQ